MKVRLLMGLLAAASLLLTACGSTVMQGGRAAAGAEGGDGLTAGEARAGVPAASSRPLAPSSGGGVASGGTVPTLDSTTTAGQTLRAGRGYTAKEIRVGFSISSDAARMLGGLGLGVEIEDQRELVTAYVNKVNREGGIAGRQVVPVIYDYSAAGDINTQDQAACETWTHDTPVFAATGVRAGTTGSGDTLTPCLAKGRVPWLQGKGDRHQWEKYLATLYNAAEMNSTREARVLVESLAAQGFFNASSKVGVVINDSSGDYSRTVREGMEPALARLGLRVTHRVVIANPQTESNNAELQMFTKGVTHVLFAAPGGAAASQFMIAAESQGRTYRFGISSQDSPGLTVQTLAPRRQLLNAMGYGYRPTLDVDGGHQPTWTPGMKACFDYYRSKGFSTSSLNIAGMAIICDSLDLLRAALRGQAAPSAESMAAAVAMLGTSLPVAGTFSSRFSSTQHDGAGGYRFLRYDGQCGCFQYSGGTRQAT